MKLLHRHPPHQWLLHPPGLKSLPQYPLRGPSHARQRCQQGGREGTRRSARWGHDDGGARAGWLSVCLYRRRCRVMLHRPYRGRRPGHARMLRTPTRAHGARPRGWLREYEHRSWSIGKPSQPGSTRCMLPSGKCHTHVPSYYCCYRHCRLHRRRHLSLPSTYCSMNSEIGECMNRMQLRWEGGWGLSEGQMKRIQAVPLGEELVAAKSLYVILWLAVVLGGSRSSQEVLVWGPIFAVLAFLSKSHLCWRTVWLHCQSHITDCLHCGGAA